MKDADSQPLKPIYDPPDEYNDGYTHEALHIASVLIDAWDRYVTETRCADEFPDVKAAAEKAADAMAAVYQLIGQKFKDE